MKNSNDPFFKNCKATLARKYGTLRTAPRAAIRLTLFPAIKYIIGLPIAFLVYVLWPIVKIRFCSIDAGRLGHLAGAIHMYLCERELGHHSNYFDFIYSKAPPVNKFLWKFATKNIRTTPLGDYINAAGQRFTNWSRHVIKVNALDLNGISTKTPAPLALDSTTIKNGDRWLESLGIKQNQSVVLFANRDPAHLNRLNPTMDWTYHNYRDSSVENMVFMAESFAYRGFAAIRMGSDVEQPLRSDVATLIDYPLNGRTEERDVYLSYRCKLFVATASGVLDIARLFHKPVANCNAVPFLALTKFKALPTDLWIPKLH